MSHLNHNQAARPASGAEMPPHAIGKDVALALLIGLLAGLLGLAPWLVTGAQLPLQNLWGAELLPQQMPLSLLPLSQYELTTLVALMTAGGAAAGLAVRLWSPVRRRLVVWCAAGGVLAVQATVTVQAFSVLDAGLAGGAMSGVYFAGLLAGVLAAIVAGMLALLLIAAKSRALTALGVGLVAVPFGSWVGEWAGNLAGAGNLSAPVMTLLRWLPAVLVGVALAWCGLRPACRAVVWLVNLAALWVVPALFISVNYVLGTRLPGRDPQEMVLMIRQILTATLGPDGGAGPTVLLALAIALAGAAVRELARRRRRR
ncbi:hypothetical protein NG701_13950 [Pseudarthrobacter sp. HLT3-5]|uniref:hypothetical protein n=1 Tax=Pseudarthrobacter cellobiosi TaxID=2953654 RepID=UPI00208F6959|nr:hypothetical protein [Pseudarthrobacter sp. HLT3-5]MCO4275520.1 hypothetical protein [Pseudarthrobacter sp. HLT3-5]